MERNRSYYAKRAAQERLAAKRARGQARTAHEQMAQRYGDLADCPEEGEE